MQTEASKSTNTAFLAGLSEGEEVGSVAPAGNEVVYVFLPNSVSPN